MSIIVNYYITFILLLLLLSTLAIVFRYTLVLSLSVHYYVYTSVKFFIILLFYISFLYFGYLVVGSLITWLDKFIVNFFHRQRSLLNYHDDKRISSPIVEFRIFLFNNPVHKSISMADLQRLSSVRPCAV